MPDWNEARAWLQGSAPAVPVLIIGAMVIMYLGRVVAHRFIQAVFGGVHHAMGLLAKALVNAQGHLTQRNREVLLEMGREAAERVIEREFDRVNATVAGDLSGYPALHRKLADQLERIDEDYRAASDVPPSPPAWVKAVETIARIPSEGDSVVGRILSDINKAIGAAHKEAMKQYRSASRERHRLLRKMLPFWRSVNQTLSRVDGTIKSLGARATVIDQQMDKYEKIRSSSDEAVRMLSASSTTVFMTSLLVVLIAMAGAFINFHLIALPMSEMVGGASHVGPLKVSDVAALVIILIEIAMGLFLMESLRITRLFPVIAMMDDHMRRRMILASFIILLTLASVEASLAYMRDMMASEREALSAQLAGMQASEGALRWIPQVGQMLMGFMLPFALTFVAIPLETLITSSRTVLGGLLAVTLRGVAGSLLVIGSFTQYLGGLATNLYDIAIVIPLWIANLFSRKAARTGARRPVSEGGAT